MIDPEDGRIAERHAVGHGPAALAAGGGSLWTANALDGTVSRIDRAHHVVTIPVGGEPRRRRYGAGSLWVADGAGRTVAQVDPGANRVVQELPAGNAPNALATRVRRALGGVRGRRRVRRIDLADSDRVRSTALAAGPDRARRRRRRGLGRERGGGHRQPARPGDGRARRLGQRGQRAQRDRRGRRRRLGRQPPPTGRSRGSTRRPTPSPGRPRWAPIPVAVAAGDEGVWVAGGDEQLLVRIDPATVRGADRIAVGSSASAIVLDHGAVWAAAVAPQARHRGGTLHVLSPVAAPGTVPIDWLTEAAYSAESNQVLSLAYDGLVGYRRVSGAARSGDRRRARDRRAAADGRRGTYRFTLRRGLRYSDGSACGRPTSAPRSSASSRSRAATSSRRSTRGSPAPGAAWPVPGAATCPRGSRPTTARARSRST